MMISILSFVKHLTLKQIRQMSGIIMINIIGQCLYCFLWYSTLCKDFLSFTPMILIIRDTYIMYSIKKKKKKGWLLEESQRTMQQSRKSSMFCDSLEYYTSVI